MASVSTGRSSQSTMHRRAHRTILIGTVRPDGHHETKVVARLDEPIAHRAEDHAPPFYREVCQSHHEPGPAETWHERCTQTRFMSRTIPGLGFLSLPTLRVEWVPRRDDTTGRSRSPSLEGAFGEIRCVLT